MTATSTAIPQTTGVYTRANRVMNRSGCALLSCASSTIAMMRLTEESLKGRVTLIFKRPLWFTQPASAALPTVHSRGMDSPVNAEVSTEELPSITSPSSGTRSPGRTRMISPTETVSALTVVTSSPFTRLAWSGRTLTSASMEAREEPTALS